MWFDLWLVGLLVIEVWDFDLEVLLKLLCGFEYVVIDMLVGLYGMWFNVVL